MMEVSTPTLKYFHLAIVKFLPALEDLAKNARKKEVKTEIIELIEIYRDIDRKIGKFHLNYEDPNRFYDGEPFDLQIEIPIEIIESLSRLVTRMLLEWQERIKGLQEKNYFTDENKDELRILKGLEWPLKAQLGNSSSFIGKFGNLGPLKFPGEDQEQEELVQSDEASGYVRIFPPQIIRQLPSDIAELCEEFNFNYANNKPTACLLLLRRILPLAIVRKFQKLDLEAEIKNDNGEFLETKALLGKMENKMSDKRIIKDIEDYKILFDSTQHSFAFSVYQTDAQGAGVKIRAFLGHLFHEIENS